MQAQTPLINNRASWAPEATPPDTAAAIYQSEISIHLSAPPPAEAAGWLALHLHCRAANEGPHEGL